MEFGADFGRHENHLYRFVTHLVPYKSKLTNYWALLLSLRKAHCKQNKPMTTEKPPTQRNKLLGLGIFAAATVGLYLYTKARPGKANLPYVYPTEQALATGRVFQTVYTPQEFELLLSSPAALNGTMFVSFVRLGEGPSNSMATNLWDIVSRVETPNTSTVAVELMGGRMEEIANRYVVNKVPSVVALKKTLPYDTYVDPAVRNSNTEVNEIDREKLQEWVENVLTRR